MPDLLWSLAAAAGIGLIFYALVKLGDRRQSSPRMHLPTKVPEVAEAKPPLGEERIELRVTDDGPEPDPNPQHLPGETDAEWFRRRGALQVEWARRELLRSLDRHEENGARRVVWMSARDAAACDYCRERDGKVFTIAAARKLVSKPRFCRAHDAEFGYTGCRCCFAPDVRDISL